MVVDKAIVKTRAYLDQAHLNATNLVVRNVVIFSNAVETRALEKFCNDYNFTGNVMVWKGLSRGKKKQAISETLLTIKASQFLKHKVFQDCSWPFYFTILVFLI